MIIKFYLTKLNILTDQQKAFVDQYVKHFNATKAAISVGYSEKTARVQASQILALDDVSLYLEDKLSAISKEAEVDAAWVRKRFKMISDRCMQAEPVMVKEDGEWVESGEFQFDSSGANKATEMLGKIIGVFEKDNDQKSTLNINWNETKTYDPNDKADTGS